MKTIHFDEPFPSHFPDFSAEMKPVVQRTLSLSDIGICMAEVEREGKDKGDRERGEEEGGGSETLSQLRRRSRKRRSFMETNFTSRVSFPEPDSNQDLDYVSRLHENLLTQAGDGQLLSSDPEPSEQTQNLCPTVSSLTHSEGEPAQLESKSILSKPRSHGPGSPGRSEYRDQDRDPRAPGNPAQSPRTRKQEMEMEPDAMESKSVTALVTVASPSITVIRCREEVVGGRKREGEMEEETGELKGASGKGPFTSHMFLAETIEVGEEEVSGPSPSSDRPLIVSERAPQYNTSPKCLMEVNAKGANVSLSLELNTPPQISYGAEDVGANIKPPSYSPPPPPPSSPLPPLPVVFKSHNDHSVRGERDREDMEIATKVSISNAEESVTISNQNHAKDEIFDVEVKINAIDDEAISSVGSATTNIDEVIDSANSDNVFEDEEISNSLNYSCSDERVIDNKVSTTDRNTAGTDTNPGTKDNIEAQTSQSPTTTSIEGHSLHSVAIIHSVNYDYASTINSITAKLVATTTLTSQTLNTGVTEDEEATNEITSGTSQNIDQLKIDTTNPSIDASSKISLVKTNIEPKAKGNYANPTITGSLAKANMATVHDLSKEPPSRFLFQTCSPNIMGRLSASTLRGKIQSLPLYLARSQETIDQAGVGNVVESPSQDTSRDDTETTIKRTCVDDVTDISNSEMIIPATEATESDDSDITVTGPEVETDLVVEMTSAEITRSTVSEVKEVVENVMMVHRSSPMPIRTEPKPVPRTLPLSPGPNKDTPGPIMEAPGLTVGNPALHVDASSPKMDTPGPIKEAPEPKMKVLSPSIDIPGPKLEVQSPSIPPPIVVTTQNLNGPGLPFHSHSEKLRRTSRDRPLIGLGRPSEQGSDSLKTLSSGCGVFTICENQPQTNAQPQLGCTLPLKPAFGCSSKLSSGCESVMEVVQKPLDACGCPVVYTNCFSGGDSFDDELTVYEFSCRTQSSGVTQTSGEGLPLMTTPCLPSFLSTSPPSFSSSSLSPSFPRSVLFPSSTLELSPLLSPLSDASACFLSQTHKDTISRLRQQRYPAPPAGFQTLRGDIDQLLSILDGGAGDRSVGGRGGRHPRDTCPAFFTENKRVLHIEARQLMAGCQKVIGVGQSPEEMLLCLADSFRTLVELAGVCLWFSGCDRCDRRNAEVVAGLADVARSFRDFCLAAERASGKRSCQDLSTKLLAKQCTALTASVFCLTQLFRTLTAL